MLKVSKLNRRKFISINLLPQEVLLAEKDVAKRTLVKKISILVLVLTSLLTAATSGVNIYQKSQVNQLQDQMDQSQQQISALKVKEGLLVSLKQRLGFISNLLSAPSKQADVYNTITTLTPPGVKVLVFNVDAKNKITVSGEASDNSSLEAFFENLTEPDKNQDQIQKVNLDNLSRTANGTFRFETSIELN
ncbi:MAG: hypothetical protein US86_C0005G0038 [Candidatus Daviesbacteria bacterium GW2011_GWA2_38_24]|uniref:Fimbrial assembly family protein n=1 Tax=Candidatus Daviesbacteria bacterium GW2011_GWA2_38_24 TaxID=1618422 RepID=A0A0G0JI28_9BACT|nr:MAG: hypothetical protein US86_C0005G0038 [Candidatus Daviesbacteria bacterium GW2011_GWA2_38_24]KKQ79610.1 MAG: hypothetical protein UT01_C0033G0003 [Candidatus Daviesbacteria bacterium GW2011_GWA1_38_7]OGE22578.1 MAG: hypothetical protein A2688_03935 [Candidatus Daviesbacteria bacterium RIFCSPHIGHO2_01_FULL_38_8]